MHCRKERKLTNLQEGKGFHDTIKKMNLKRFGEAKSKRVKGTNREIILKADRRLFGTMILIAKNRKLDNCNMYHRRGTKSHVRMVDIARVATVLEVKCVHYYLDFMNGLDVIL